MPMMKNMLALGCAAAILTASGLAWAQGNNETPRPPGSDPSTTVDRLQGLPAPPIGSPGNPTGSLDGLPSIQPPANANRADPSRIPGNSRPLDARTTPGTPGASGTSGTPSPTN